MDDLGKRRVIKEKQKTQKYIHINGYKQTHKRTEYTLVKRKKKKEKEKQKRKFLMGN